MGSAGRPRGPCLHPPPSLSVPLTTSQKAEAASSWWLVALPRGGPFQHSLLVFEIEANSAVELWGPLVVCFGAETVATGNLKTT